jgi:hypothetical protein
VNDTALDELLRAQARVDDDTVAGWEFAGADLALLDGIVAGEEGTPAPRPPWYRRHGRLVAVAAAALAVACGVTGATLVAPGGGGVTSAYADEVVRAAERMPRLLIDDPAWKIATVAQWDDDSGEMHFTDGRHDVQLNWYGASLLDSYVRDRVESGLTGGPVRFVGRDMIAMSRDRRPVDILGLVDDHTMIELAVDPEVFATVRAKTRLAGVDEWLDALPRTVFDGTRRSLAIDELLGGIPVPPGYDPRALKRRGLISDRYSLGAAVLQDIGCAWFGRWFDARDKGDATAAAQASRVLRGSGNWPVMREMAAQGDYPQFFLQRAEATKNGLINAAHPRIPLTRARMASIGCNL